jgi:hypothetical protein
VVAAIAAGTVADAVSRGRKAVNAAPETASPCRANRFANIARAVPSRLATVPSGT